MTTDPMNGGPMIERRQRISVLVLRLAVSAALIAWLLHRIDLGGAVGLLLGVDFWWLVAAVLCLLATHALNVWRWRYCLLDAGDRISPSTLALSYWTSFAVGLALPSELGGDVVRARDMQRQTGSGSTAVASVLWSRFSGLLAALGFLVVAGALAAQRLSSSPVLWWSWLVGLGLTVCALLSLWLLPKLRLDARPRSSRPPSWLRRAADGLSQRLRLLAADHRYGSRILLLALVAQLTMVLTNGFYARALGQSIGWLDMAMVVSLVAASSVLPISLGGLGVKEGAFVLSLTAVGMAGEAALGLALLNRLVLLGFAGVGACLLPLRSRLSPVDSAAAARQGEAGR